MGENSEYILDTLREGAVFTLYRGIERSNLMPILAAAAGELPTLLSLRRLEHEYSLAAELNAAWAAQPIALTRHQGRAALILKDPGGEPLDQVIEQQKGQQIDLIRFLRMAIGLAAALGQCHRKGLIHKDIQPANALVDDSGDVWLTGFGIASRLPRERLTPTPPEIIADTLAYISPEQTGRMNRSIDSRSDLYSLGVTLYQMLTGVLPFAAADPLEWVHCHIARQPVAPIDRRPVPKPLSDLIMKLLAKNAEERYQTAAGLEADLQWCQSEWQSHGRIDPFSLGADDLSDRLSIPEKLYGREHEVDALHAAFDRVVAQGAAELVLVSGYSGVGKSSVVNELHKALVAPHGLFAAGKFDRYKSDTPYATLAQAFRSLIRQILSKRETELRDWREAIGEALGANGLLIVNLIPELELVTGKQPPVADLSPQDAQRRFQAVLRRFIGVFARPQHPLALFLDDLQWVDAATLDLLEDLLSQGDIGHLLLIGAYRNNEVDSEHPLVRKLEAMRGAGARVRDIVLTPLSDGDLGRLISDALHCELDRARPLTQLVHEKTGGNPFFAIQFLHALEDEALLVFDHADMRWSWDLGRIRAKHYSDNVIDLMVANLNRLPAETSAALCQLACFGSGATFDLLATVCQTSPENLHDNLWEAVRAGLVLRSEDAYAFQHDRIQEAAYSLIADDARAEVHLRIGRLLLAHTSPKARDGIIFEIVGQFNRGRAFIIAPDESEQVGQLNLIAGKRAKDAAAYASALGFFADGRALLAEDCWTRQYRLTFELELHRAECEFLTGELVSAEERLSMLADQATNFVDQAAVTCLRVDLYIILVRPERAFDVGLKYLKQVGFELSPRPTDEEVRQEYERIWQRLGTRAIEDLIDLPLMNDNGKRATIDVLNKLLLSAQYQDRRHQHRRLHQLLPAQMVNFSIEHGNSAASCVGYAWLGRVLASDFGDYSAALRFGQLSLDLVDKRGLDTFRTRVYFIFGTGISPWVQHLRLGRAFFLRASSEANKIGDLPYIGFCHSNVVGNLISSGEHLLDVDRAAMEGLDFAHKTRSRISAAYILGQLCLIRSLRGLPCNFKSYDDEEFDAEKFEGRLGPDSNLAIAADMYWNRRIQAFVFEEDYESALEAAARPHTLLLRPSSNIERAEYHFYVALARAGSVVTVDSARNEQEIGHLEALRVHYRQLQLWAENCPENFESRAALVGAELARLEGRELEAERLYAQAIRAARASSFINNEALACEIAARFYAARGFEGIAEMYLVKARERYACWGADSKVKQLNERYPSLRKERVPAMSAPFGPLVTQWDVESIVKASQALSSEMILPTLIEKLVRIAVENAGAERGLLILSRDGESQIEAESTISLGKIEVTARHAAITPSDLPQSVLHYVMRTRERVLLDDASSDSVYSKDDYVRLNHSRSVLCLPIVKQAELIGALYIENNLTPYAFTPERIAVLDLLTSQASISLENATLYSELHRSEAFLAQGQRISQTGSFGWSVASGESYWSEELYNILEYDRSAQASVDLAMLRVHPDDRNSVQRAFDDAIREKKDFDSQHRLLMPDGRVKHVHTTGRAATNGNLEFVGAVRDVTERVRAEEQLTRKLRQSEKDLRMITDTIRQPIVVMGADGTALYANRVVLEKSGLTIDEVKEEGFLKRTCHPDDVERVFNERNIGLSKGILFDTETRTLQKNGEYRWQLLQYNPLQDESGKIIRWYATATDIDDQKKTQERLRDENLKLDQERVYLEEQIRSEMGFEQIIGNSSALKHVLQLVETVASTDSTVLLLGETGTGKELIARAIHERSRRKGKTFVKLNCAAIPTGLLESELFGHEKGAFTGAIIQKVGRMELADQGTLFLDEVGDIPVDIQPKLLRALQEREFERLGSTHTRKVNFRLVAATNRNLENMVADREFRSDLFYRLNVFPIRIPPLRERKEDIPLLVSFFVEKFARQMQKRIDSIPVATMKALTAWDWPGNIRELENFIERAIILSRGESLTAPLSELRSVQEGTARHSVPKTEDDIARIVEQTIASLKKNKSAPNEHMKKQHEEIVRVLTECNGRVGGGDGAAVRLGLSRTTLISRMKRLGINPYDYA